MKARNLFVAVAMLCVATTALAGTSSYYLTALEYRPGNAVGFNYSGLINGSNDVVASPTLATTNNLNVFIQPTYSTVAAGCANRHVIAGVDTASAALQVWTNVQDSAAIVEIMGSIGLNVAEVGGVGPNLPTYVSTIYDNVPSRVGSTVDPWDGTNIVTPQLTDLRMVTVPESVPDFAVTGLAPNAGGASYRIATVTATGGCGQKFDAESQVDLHLQTGNVLIARINDPAEAAVGAETVNFGWTGAGVPELVGIPGGCTATGAGSCAGAQSTTREARIRVVYKGDYAGGAGGVPDGNVSGADNLGFNTAKAAVLANTATAEQKFKGDFAGGAGGVPDGTATGADNLGFNAQKACFLAAFTACP